IEAGRALGLSQAQLLEKIVLPQALRVIIPPLGNQYLNLSKNSSLAIGIGYADTFTTTVTIMNQSGQSVTGFLMVMVTFLALSLLIALFMNAVNRRFQLVTR
ncbi:MAG: ABC transporter permease subunit, partial [Anaerolineaceae bacterium]|nr:ABC transporter permease subunit [Anaerolineaceae bacterium]